jgi:hypothetical protein
MPVPPELVLEHIPTLQRNWRWLYFSELARLVSQHIFSFFLGSCLSHPKTRREQMMTYRIMRTKWLAGLLALAALLSWSSARAEVRIVCIGDSNIAGKGVSSSEAYPAQLERALRARGNRCDRHQCGN